MKEMISFLNCLSLNNINDEKCARQKELLRACMDAQVILYLICSAFVFFFSIFSILVQFKKKNIQFFFLAIAHKMDIGKYFNCNFAGN